MVANYEGYLFYRSLFEDGIVPGKKAIVAFENDRALIARPFAWSDHVNDYWDEALNPSLLGAGLRLHVSRELSALCSAYATRLDLFVPVQDAELARRYAHIGMKDARYNRLDRFCSGEPSPAPTPPASALAGK